jgi:peptidoglycan-associated lipoprotein
MTRLLRSAPVVVSLVALAVLVTGCPKRPGTALSSAPAPSGAAGGSQSSTAMVPAARTSPSGGAALVPPRPSEFSATSSLKEIHFDFDRYDIRPADAKILDANAAWLKSRPEDLVLIEGHCDERGTNEYNLALGERRAKATMNYLVGQGVQARRITLISYGKEKPACASHDEGCWAMNRRAQLLVKAR